MQLNIFQFHEYVYLFLSVFFSRSKYIKLALYIIYFKIDNYLFILKNLKFKNWCNQAFFHNIIFLQFEIIYVVLQLL